MQNIPDKGVKASLHYLRAEHTVTGLSRSLPEVKRRMGKRLRAIPFWEGHFGRKIHAILARRMWSELLSLPGPPLKTR
jgi:hypothetical protein